MKKYVFEVTIEEGNDEFWEELNKRNSTGCDEVQECVRICLDEQGFQEGYGTTIRLKSFTNT